MVGRPRPQGLKFSGQLRWKLALIPDIDVRDIFGEYSVTYTYNGITFLIVAGLLL
jgi:hypothetical protein